MFRNYFKTAIRTFFKNKLYTTLNVAGKSVTNFVLIWKKQSDNSYEIFRDYLTDIEFKKTK